jgi:ornithine cyclodeaminase
LIEALRRGFVNFHEGRSVVAPIINLAIAEHNGEMHIKPGYLLGSGQICVKVVTYYYDNPRHGLPTRDGALLLADRMNGRMIALLADEGLITDMRTAASSAVAVDALAPQGDLVLGLVGSGTQSFWHAAAVKAVRPIVEVRVWGRDASRSAALAQRITQKLGLVARATGLGEAARSGVVVTATPAQQPILVEPAIEAGAVIVAMGADAVGKRELGLKAIERATGIVVDSLEQCRQYGELQLMFLQSACCLLAAELVAQPRHDRTSCHVIIDVEGYAAGVKRTVCGRSEIDVDILDPKHEVLRQQILNSEARRPTVMDLGLAG